MLWRFRREIILLIFLGAGFALLRHGFHFPRPLFHKPVQPSSVQTIEGLVRENERLRSLLNLTNEKTYRKIIVCSVVGISPWVYPTEVTVNRGSTDGIEPGMSIISGKGSLIGRIVSVSEHSASGITLFHKDNKVSVLICSTGEIGILEGGSFPYLRVKFLPPNCRAAPGDIVETSNMTQLFPVHTRIGKLVRVSGSSKELTMQGFLRPSFYEESFEDVAVVK
jgi:rod shape-determining protein MreC